MTVIACVDNSMGMLFNRRRQSSDRAQRNAMLRLCGDTVLRVSPYSAALFSGEDCTRIIASEDFLDGAVPGDICFTEKTDPAPYADAIERVVLYRWNRNYPSDMRFTLPLDCGVFRLVSTRDFPGSSHENITEEIYEKCTVTD